MPLRATSIFSTEAGSLPVKGSVKCEVSSAPLEDTHSQVDNLNQDHSGRDVHGFKASREVDFVLSSADHIRCSGSLSALVRILRH